MISTFWRSFFQLSHPGQSYVNITTSFTPKIHVYLLFVWQCSFSQFLDIRNLRSDMMAYRYLSTSSSIQSFYFSYLATSIHFSDCRNKMHTGIDARNFYLFCTS